MPYYYAEPTGALLQHSNKAFKFKQRLDFKRYTFLRTRGFSIVIRHSLPTKASFQKVYFFFGTPCILPRTRKALDTSEPRMRKKTRSYTLRAIKITLSYAW